MTRLGAWHLRAIRVLFWVLMALVGASVILEWGVIQCEDQSSGPFRRSVSAPEQYAADIGSGIPFGLAPRLVDRAPYDQPPSGLSLRQDGTQIALPATPRPQIRIGKGTPPSVRPREVSFALPEGVSNQGNLDLSISYTLRFHRTFTDVVWICFVLVGILRLFLAREMILSALTRASRRVSHIVSVAPQFAVAVSRGAAAAFVPKFVRPLVSVGSLLLLALTLVFPLVVAVVFAGCVGYAATILYGAFIGDLLASTAVFFIVPPGILLDAEPYFPIAIVAFAAAGTLLAWAVALRLLPKEPVQNLELRLSALCGWVGFPIIVLLLLFSLSAGGWSGNIRPQDIPYMSLAGLIPHSDAADYFSDVYSLAFTGQWDVKGSRRPVGEVFRQITAIASNYSYVGALLVQLFLVAAALFCAARTVALRYGIWAGIAFVGFTYLLARPFLFATLTEPFGLIWALFAIAFFVESFRLNSLPHALVGLAALTLALLSRMGSMFTLPFLAIWIACAFAVSWRSRARALALCFGTIIAILALNGLLAFLYASPSGGTGSNFSRVICGLSLGTDWIDCLRVYRSQLQMYPDERSRALFLFAMAWQDFAGNPHVLLSKVAANVVSYYAYLPRFLFMGYSPAYSINDDVIKAAFGLLLASTVTFLWLRRARAEAAFWIVLFASIGVSAAFIIGDDGWRTLHVTHALVGCFFAIGFSATPVDKQPSRGPLWSWKGGVSVIVIVAALFVAAPKVSNLMVASRLGSFPTVDTDDHVVLGGRQITGFLVVPDDERRSSLVPTLQHSRFVELVRLSGWEGSLDFGPFLEGLPPPPFAFVLGIRPREANLLNVYVSPPSVFLAGHVCAWRFAVRGLESKARESRRFFHVLSAQELARTEASGRGCLL